MNLPRVRLRLVLVLLAFVGDLNAQEPAGKLDTARGDAMIAEYFRTETAALAGSPVSDLKSAEDWQARRGELRRQLAEMLGLDPMPEKTDLKATVTGRIPRDDFSVEKVHFQSRPGLYVTGNLYLPKPAADADKPARFPAVLYVCGHGGVEKNGISYGNKPYFQHHGAWFAQNGFVCLIIDTLQLGEIRGTHHGTYGVRKDGKFQQMWWWNARGYTSAGVEAWNSIRAIDYLVSRPEVDPARLGVTGISGGGAYSWWLASLDERIQCAVPVAGITDLTNHVVDGTVEGHCDCMFPINTYRWDFGQVAALVSPRALLISNADKDNIFPLEGVLRVHQQARQVYRFDKANDKLGLHITEGPHKDTQELQVHAFRWFNYHLRKDESQVKPAEKYFEPEQLKVFETLPADQVNTRIHETFVAAAPDPVIPVDAAAWEKQQETWRRALTEKVFRGWPQKPEPLGITEAFRVSREGIELAAYDFTSQGPVRLRLYVAQRAGLARRDLDLVVLNTLDEQGWNDWLRTMRSAFAKELAGEGLHGEGASETNAKEFASTQQMFAKQKWGMAWLAPRGIGPTAWNQSERKQTQHRRRFMLLGQTLDGMRVWDVRRGTQALRELADGELAKTPLWMQGERRMAGVTLYASLFEPQVTRLDLWYLSPSHQPDFAQPGETYADAGPDFVNVLRHLDVPQAVAMAAGRSKVRIYEQSQGKEPLLVAKDRWEFPRKVAEKLGSDPKQLEVRKIPERP